MASAGLSFFPPTQNRQSTDRAFERPGDEASACLHGIGQLLDTHICVLGILVAG